MDENYIKKLKWYYEHKAIEDYFSFAYLKIKEILLGTDKDVFDKSIKYYKENFDKKISYKEAKQIALDKNSHKDRFFDKKRESVNDIISFYSEVHIYPFRQPYLKRFLNFYWIEKIAKLVHEKNKKVNILEYGCGSAVLTEQLIKRCPQYNYFVADIPSTTLDFVKWKKKTYGFEYKILEIEAGKIPLDPEKQKFDIIICKDVLEHTFNPYEIVKSFIRTLDANSVLLTDFINDPGGENLKTAVEKREDVKKILEDNLIPIKKIDDKGTHDGFYVKSE